eukprot:gene6036-6274_t
MVAVASHQPENGACDGADVRRTSHPLKPGSVQLVTGVAHDALALRTAHTSSLRDGVAAATPEQTAASSTAIKQRKRRKAPSIAEHRAWLQRIMAAAEAEEAAEKASPDAAGLTLGASVQSDVLVQLAAHSTGSGAASSGKATKRRSKRDRQLAAAAAEQAPADVHGSVGQGAVGAVKVCADDDSSPENATAPAHGSQNKGRGKKTRSSKQALCQPMSESAAAVADVPRHMAAADDEQVAGQAAVADASSQGRGKDKRVSRGRQKQASPSTDHDGTEVVPAVDAVVAMTAAMDVSAVMGTDSITPSARRGKRKAKSAAADIEVEAAAGGDGDALQADAPEAAKPKRSRSKRATALSAEGDAAAVLVKPVRRTKKVIAEEVREAARLGQFGELTLLSGAYSHISLFTGISNSQAWDELQGSVKVSQLALANARDLLPLILWNEAHGIRLFRLSSCILPWMTSYRMEELPDWPDIQLALRAAGDAAKQLGHRLTFHPSEYCKIAGERLEWVKQSVQELEVHSRIFDEMGFLPATPHNKINIHVGGTYGGNKDATLRRFSRVVNEQLSPNCKARLTVENDDKASMYSVADLQLVHQLTGIPIVFDFHHWKFCTGGQTQEEAFKSAVATWPAGVRPLVHWSESPEAPNKRRSAHSEYVDGPMCLYGLEGQVDVMIESKAKELALLEYRQSVLEGWTVKPRHKNWKGTDDPALDITPADVMAAQAAAAEAEAVEAAAAAEDVDGDGDDDEDGEQQGISTAAVAITTGLSEAEVKQLKEVFDLMDKDKGGTLSAEEVHELLQLLGMKMRLDEVQQMIFEIDRDNSGTVDFEEFLQVASKPQQLPYSRADLLRSFRMFADKDAPPGSISPEALEAALLTYCQDMLDAAEISRLVHTLDTSKDGFIQYKDMVNLLASK